jgi:hypothetical protein
VDVMVTVDVKVLVDVVVINDVVVLLEHPDNVNIDKIINIISPMCINIFLFPMFVSFEINSRNTGHNFPNLNQFTDSFMEKA